MKNLRVRKISNIKKVILIILIVLICTPLVITLGRFVYNKVIDLYFQTQNFYFESDKLTKDGANYSLDYWNGVDPYDIVVNLNSYKNNNLKSTSDITYDISYSCSDTVICTSNKNEGTIYSTTNTDSFTISMNPNSTFKDNDSVIIEIKAKSKEPYQKELSAVFKLVVGKYGLSHEIIDNQNNPYLELSVTNTLNYYTVINAFNNYQVQDRLDEETYNNLSDAEKENCASAIIHVSFDPNIVYIDNTNTTYLDSYDQSTTKINGFDYINAFTFRMDSSSSNIVKFYKKDPSKDYSNDDSIIEVSYEF